MHRHGVCLVAACFAVALAITTEAAEPETLTVLTWGGAYEASQRAAYFAPFEAATGVQVRTTQYNGGISALRKKVVAGQADWDVVDLVVADARAACREGLLEPLPADLLDAAPDGTPAQDDFDDGAFSRCAIAQLVFSTVIAFDIRAFPGEKPRTVADFFDLERFPGKRGLRCSPDAMLEWALLAYGVPASQVYDLLSTERGMALAFRKLDTIRDHLVWWREGEEPIGLLAGGTVTMTSGYNGRFFNAQIVGGEPLAIIWDGQLIDYATWAIPNGAARSDLAKQFIRFATRAEAMARQVSHISYAPTRASARRRIGRHISTGTDMSAHLPTTGERMRRAIREDSEWYAHTAATRGRRFAAWLGAQDACEQ